MAGNLGGWTGIILLVIILLLFGGNKLPGLAKGLAQSMRIFKSEIKTPPAEAGAEGKSRSDEPREAKSTSDDLQEPHSRPER